MLARPPSDIRPRTQGPGADARDGHPHLHPDDVAREEACPGHNWPGLCPCDKRASGLIHSQLRRRPPGQLLLGPRGKPSPHRP